MSNNSSASAVAPTNVSENQSAPKKQQILPGKFNGQNRATAVGIYNTLIAVKALRSDYGRLVCHKIAFDYISQWSAAVANQELNDKDGKVKVGKVDKDGASNHTIKQVARGLRTDAGNIVGIACRVDEMKEQGLIVSRFFPPLECLPEGIHKYLDACAAWAETVEEVDVKGKVVVAKVEEKEENSEDETEE